MKTKIHSQSGVFNPRILAAFAVGSVGVLLAMLSFAANPPGGMKTPPASSAGASAFIDNYAVPLKGNLAAPAPSMPLAPTGPTWSIVTSPNTSATEHNYLSDVTCASASDCWTVGYDNTGDDVDQTLIERWNGTAWSVVTSPNTSATQDNDLRGVACASASDCWAVGSYGYPSVDQTLIEHWNGTAWSIVTSPNAMGPNYLSGVTCASASDCWAVGGYRNGLYNQTLIEHWNGTAWSIVTSPNTSATQNNGLGGVTCASASNCWAVGSYFNFSIIKNQPHHTLIERWNGTAWSIVTSPNTSTTQYNHLSGVTCTSAPDCWAVGYGGQALIEHWNGTAWSIVTSPDTGVLSDVTCTSASDCWAVGYYSTDEANNTLTEHWNGTAWSIVTSPNSGTNENYLNGVTCASASDCWAVGYYWNGSVYHTLIERYSSVVPAQLDNISTRGFVQTGDDVMIGGFIVQGIGPKTVIIRAIGPELTQYGIPNALADPTLELHDSTRALIASNNNWQTTIRGGIITSDQVSAIQNSGHAPTQPSESAIIATLPPGSYTAIVSGVNNTVGVALVEVYDLSTSTTSILGNISTRGFVQTGDDVMIGGFIVGSSSNFLVRALGPTLGAPPFNIPGAMSDSTLELHTTDNMGHDVVVATNDNWKVDDQAHQSQEAAITATGKAPSHDFESAILRTLGPGNYTAILKGKNNTTGIALLEVYNVP